MGIFESPLLIAVLPVLIGTLGTIYVAQQNKKSSNYDNELIKILKRELEEERKKK